MSKYDGMLDLPWFEDERGEKFYYADEVNQRIAELEAALRELYDQSPYVPEGELTERIDKLLGYESETGGVKP